MFFSARKLRAKLQYFSDICKENRRFSIRTADFCVSLCLGLVSVFSRPSVGGTQIKERHPTDASPYYIRTCVRTLLPLRAEHAEVTLVTPLSVLLSGGEELVCLFRELFFAGKFLVYVPKLRSGSKYSEQLRSPHKLKFTGTP